MSKLSLKPQHCIRKHSIVRFHFKMRDKVIDQIKRVFWLQTLLFNSVALPIQYKITRVINGGLLLSFSHILQMYHC